MSEFAKEEYIGPVKLEAEELFFLGCAGGYEQKEVEGIFYQFDSTAEIVGLW